MFFPKAVEHFEKLLREQLARQEAMEKGAQRKDFSNMEKIVIGLIDGDGDLVGIIGHLGDGIDDETVVLSAVVGCHDVETVA